MANEPIDEYEFSDGEQASEPKFVTEPPKKSGMTPATRKKLLGLFGAIVVVFIVLTYKSKEEPPVVAVQPPPAVSNINLERQNLQQEEARAAAQQQAAQEAAAQKAMQQEALMNSVKANASEAQSLKSQVNQLHSQLTQSQALTERLTSQVAALQKTLNVFKLEQKRIAFEQQPKTYVKAIIPGRAWIDTAKGDLTSVILGDHIQGYGTVIAINQSKGIVLTQDKDGVQHTLNYAIAN